MMHDILSFGKPTILLGDPCQLKPIMQKPNPYLNQDKLDGFLNKPLRYNDESGILTLANLTREGKNLHYGKYNKSSVVKLSEVESKMIHYDVVLCHLNKTRNQVNVIFRDKLGFAKQSIYPRKGEKIICLKNNYNYELSYDDMQIFLINGLVGIVLEDSYINKETGKLMIKFIPDFMYDKYQNGYITECFNVPSHPEYFEYLYYNDVELPLMYSKGFDNSDSTDEDDDLTNFITYGYSLTCTKSQGSEFNKVLVLDDYAGPRKEYYNFLYTAITRAKEFVTYASLK